MISFDTEVTDALKKAIAKLAGNDIEATMVTLSKS